MLRKNKNFARHENNFFFFKIMNCNKMVENFKMAERRYGAGKLVYIFEYTIESYFFLEEQSKNNV
jgi:hypothetical protein